MNRLQRTFWLAPILLLLAAHQAGHAAERAVSAPEKPPEEKSLLLPAVQKAQAPEAESDAETKPARAVTPGPQKGIEPDEIDARNRARAPAAPDRAGATTRPAPAAAPRASGQKLSVQQMMVKLKPRQPMAVAATTGGSTAGQNVQAKPAEPPKYEIADCGTATSPMICCHHEAGDGSSCNLFKILCGNAGGTAQGDGESAACSDW
ncbi:MAG TPA: hypothetical protein PLI48_00535 [Gammaproteobacteria bacterium]|nr:hypothetical protein [Gammaproteobacteria bacterium]HRP86820.1 hypothetical protein [Gammaproteobacteria bacterium]